MTLIEGVGDEVTQFFLLVVIASVGLIAWWSTSIADQPLIRTVLILERRTRVNRVPPEVAPTPTTTTTSLDNNIDTGQLVSTSNNETQTEIEDGATSGISDKETNIPSPAAASSSQELNVSQSRRESPQTDTNDVNESTDSGQLFQSTSSSPLARVNLTEVDGEVDISSLSSEAQDNTDANLLRRRRLAFFQSRQETLLDSLGLDEAILSTNMPVESDTTEAPDRFHTQECPSEMPEHSNDIPTAGSIRIRLKYLNDDQKLVEGRLQEQLGDFKRRHFGLELSADKLVRLIFNGQVLQRDSETLQGYGLFDNCVVHCLVHNQRSGTANQSGASENQSGRESSPNNTAEGTPQRDWDLGNLLFASLSLILGIAWYCRYQYAQLFNATTTVALVGLTGILTVSLVGIYLPDSDGIRH